MAGGLGLSNLIGAALIIVAFVVVLAFGAQIVNNIGTGFTAGSVPKNITDNGLNGLRTFGSYTPTISTVVIGVIIIGLLIGGFYFLLKGGNM